MAKDIANVHVGCPVQSVTFEDGKILVHHSDSVGTVTTVQSPVAIHQGWIKSWPPFTG